jgi:hypothetical protein
MSVNAILDSIGQNLDGTYVAYVKLYKDNVFNKDICINYDPNNVLKFKAEIEKRLLDLENIIEIDIKPKIEIALTETVAKITVELAKAKELIVAEVIK